MNTLLGEIATLNDVQFYRYRIAFKLRKLQKSFLLEHGTVGMLSEVLHLTAVQKLHHDDIVPLSQLSTVLTELYGAIRTTRPILKQAQIQQAHDWAYNWLQMAFNGSSQQKIQATSLKLTLCLFLGSKVTDKARFIFSVLANTNGAIEKDGFKRFLRVTRQLARTVHEDMYHQYQNLDTIFQESLVCVRSSEDVEEEELDGGIRRQWLSQFEFTKLLTLSPPPPFFNWLHFLLQLPDCEKVLHIVRCAICARKPIISLRYECVQCHNFHMCQMCFLKGRTTDKHLAAHQVLEFTTNRSSSRRHFFGLSHRRMPSGGKMVTDKKEPFSYRSASHMSGDSLDADVAMTAITDMIATSQRSFDNTDFSERKKSHRPAIIRIGSDGKILSPKKETPTHGVPPTHTIHTTHTLHTSPAHRASLTSSGSSPDSISSGGKFSFDGGHQRISATANDKPVSDGTRHMRVYHSDTSVLPQRTTSRQKDLAAINKRLSMEVDKILLDLPSPPPHPSRNMLTLAPTLSLKKNHIHGNGSLDNELEGIHQEEEQLQAQVAQLTDKRQKLSHDLQDLLTQVQSMQVGFQTLGRGNHSSSSLSRSNAYTSYHSRSDSAPIAAPSSSPSSSPEIVLPPLAEDLQQSVQLRQKKEGGARKDGRSAVYTPPLGVSQFHDPLSEFHSDLLDVRSDSNADQRFSVAW